MNDGAKTFSDVSVQIDPDNLSIELAKIPEASNKYSSYLSEIEKAIANNVWKSAEYAKIKDTFDGYLKSMKAAEAELNKLKELAGKLEQAVVDTGSGLAGKFGGESGGTN